MRALSALAFVLAVATGCGASSAGSGGQHCTLIGSPAGINIDVSQEVAKQAGETARVRACWAGGCHEREVRLRQNTTSKDMGCTDGACSGKMLPAAGKVGFANLPELPSDPVRVTLTLTGSDGTHIVRDTVRVMPQPTYPNGRDCGEGGPQAGLLVTAAGEVRAQ